MSENQHNCPQCSRKIMQSISNRCMYCGADLPEEHYLTQQEKNALLSAKMDQFRQNEENADNIISSLRKDFALPEKKVRKNRKDTCKDIKDSQQENAAVIAAALASINSQNKDGGNNSSE